MITCCVDGTVLTRIKIALESAARIVVTAWNCQRIHAYSMESLKYFARNSATADRLTMEDASIMSANVPVSVQKVALNCSVIRKKGASIEGIHDFRFV